MQNVQIEKVIFGNLINREDYGRKVIPFLTTDYFQDRTDKVLFELIDDYVSKYNKFPTTETLLIDLASKNGLDQGVHDSIRESIETLDYDPKTDLDWLLTRTEQFCQEKAIYNGIMKSIQILDNKDEKNTKDAIPEILSDALAVNFDTNIGHSFIDDADARFEFYRRKEERIPFGLEYFNIITKGGLPKKTLSAVLASTGVGKSLFMTHCAANNLMDGKNVLFITLEMAEERIAERIDCNLLDVTIEELSIMPLDSFQKKIAKVKNKTTGKLIIKEYPTSTAGSANFRHLLNELKIKKNFVPDIIYIDYLNICASSRIKYTSSVNSYTYVKAIAEELRGLAVEFNVPIFTATQTNRSGYNNSEIELTDTSESIGLPMTLDLFFALINSEELESLNQLMVKQLKNRFNDPSRNKRFVIGVDRSKMRLYDVDNAEEGIVDDRPVMDKSNFGERDNNDNDFFGKRSKFKKKNWNGFG